MKEHDYESYKRKYHNTITVINNNGNLEAYFIKGMNEDPLTFITEKEEFKISNTIFPVYYPFQAGIYNAGPIFYYLTRRMKKNWKIGMCPDNWTFLNLTPNFRTDWRYLDPLKEPIVNIDKALATEGPISKHLYISKGSVIYKGKNLGIRNKRNFLVSPAIQQEVLDALIGKECDVKC